MAPTAALEAAEHLAEVSAHLKAAIGGSRMDSASVVVNEAELFSAVLSARKAAVEVVERFPWMRALAARLVAAADAVEENLGLKGSNDRGDSPHRCSPRGFASPFASAMVRCDSGGHGDSATSPAFNRSPLPQGAKVRHGIVMTGQGAWRA
jgi:hypothetical protein